MVSVIVVVAVLTVVAVIVIANCSVAKNKQCPDILGQQLFRG